jgi:hypothetical protein
MAAKLPSTVLPPISEYEHQLSGKLLRERFHELMSLGSIREKAVCKLACSSFVSNFGLAYFDKLNLAVKEKTVAVNDESTDSFCTWIDNDVMELFEILCEADVFDQPKSISALTGILQALYSNFELIESEDIEENAGYLFDVPYRLLEMVKETPEIPRFQKYSVKREEREKIEKLKIHVTGNAVAMSYRVDVKR